MPRVLAWLRLHPAGFSSSYPPRRVNNIYFDTPDLANVEDNLAGVSERRKIRLRWYGQTNEIVRGVWELKRKKAGLGWKETQKLGCSIALDRPATWMQIVPRLRGTASAAMAAHLDSRFVPTLINHYERRYYESWNGTVRATVDYDQAFFDQRFSAMPNLNRRKPSADDLVLELKAAPEHYDRLVGVVQSFPMRLARNSKYVNGILGYAAT